ncbi:MAG TPA: hypothetical protein PLW68_08605 [Casimicrobiaceae bacterium]|nr:hypothetical protein [Casimicrobiaceae bacterium]
MNRLYLLMAASILFSGCAAWKTGPQPDDPADDKVMQVGSHIPVKDRSTGKAVTTGDVDSMMRNQRSQNAGANNAR